MAFLQGPKLQCVLSVIAENWYGNSLGQDKALTQFSAQTDSTRRRWSLLKIAKIDFFKNLEKSTKSEKCPKKAFLCTLRLWHICFMGHFLTLNRIPRSKVTFETHNLVIWPCLGWKTSFWPILFFWSKRGHMTKLYVSKVIFDLEIRFSVKNWP